ncbi:PREDICTED: methyl-CpG-binding domain protein 4-like protein [Lupinus angustifolius]|uniref:methyl-CpG-binding domain protein 4-like protein n=1 Tax=Lupinus angustifolius TaxID=3871 RepID=UPI00092E4DF9|nr:PREDICTED: methyl-CpG-binding domain protein 4-like protein [Lupinus angustifolius]
MKFRVRYLHRILVLLFCSRCSVWRVAAEKVRGVVVIVAAVRRMKGKEDENASKTIIIDSRKMRTPDVKYVSAHFNTVGENNVVVIPKRKSNVNSTENSNINAKKMRNNDVRYVSAYFNTVAEENVIIIPKRSRMKNENKVENDTNIIYVSAYFDFSKIRTKNVVVIPPRAKKNEIEMIDMHKDVKPLKSLPSELCSDAYRRKTHNNTWKPPKSLFRFEPLLQEYYVYDPWRVLVTSVLLNLTTGAQVRRVLSNLFNLCPNAKSCIEVEVQEIEQVIKTLGLQNKRAKALQRLSHEYLYGSWTHVTQLHGVGKYVGDAYAIFCTGEWRNVTPTDKELLPYWNYLWSIM